MKVFLDTHVAIALFEGKARVFGPRARDLLERSALFVSPVVRLEATYLLEIGRLSVAPQEIFVTLAEDLDVRFSEDAMHEVISYAVGLSWTRDPFDRLLVATAVLHRSPLVTRDRSIRDNFDGAVW